MRCVNLLFVAMIDLAPHVVGRVLPSLPSVSIRDMAVLVLLSPRLPGSAPLIGADGIVAADVADPLPKAFALTAIVISFAVVTLVLALAHQMFDTPTGGPGSAPEDPAGPEEPS